MVFDAFRSLWNIEIMRLRRNRSHMLPITSHMHPEADYFVIIGRFGPDFVMFRDVPLVQTQTDISPRYLNGLFCCECVAVRSSIPKHTPPPPPRWAAARQIIDGRCQKNSLEKAKREMVAFTHVDMHLINVSFER